MPNLNYDGTQDGTQDGTLDGTQEDIHALILEMIKRNNKSRQNRCLESLVSAFVLYAERLRKWIMLSTSAMDIVVTGK